MTLRDEETRLENPCKKFLKFSSKKVSYYDKEKKENVEVKTPFEFTALIQLSAMSGFDEANQCGIYSNEVEKLGEQLMKVVSFKGGDIACGLYGDIKDKAKGKGARYTASVYGLLDGELVNLQLRGASLQGWIEKTPGTKFKVGAYTEGKKGAIKYDIPTFEPVSFKDEEEKKAARDALDDLMKNYLHKYWAQKQEENETFFNNGFNTDVVMGGGMSDVEARKADKAEMREAKKAHKESTGGVVGKALLEAIEKDSPTEEDLPF